MIELNARTDFSSVVSQPQIDPTAYVHPLAAAIGNIIIGRNVFMAPGSSVRGDEGQPLHVGDDANVQDGVVIHALETEQDGQPIPAHRVTVDGTDYAVYVGRRVSLAHQVQIHGPAVVMDDTFVGMKTLVFKSRVGRNCVIEPACVLMGVTVADNRYVPAGTVLKEQAAADALPEVTADYAFKDLNRGVVHVNVELARAYLRRG